MDCLGQSTPPIQEIGTHLGPERGKDVVALGPHGSHQLGGSFRLSTVHSRLLRHLCLPSRRFAPHRRQLLPTRNSKCSKTRTVKLLYLLPSSRSISLRVVWEPHQAQGLSLGLGRALVLLQRFYLQQQRGLPAGSPVRLQLCGQLVSARLCLGKLPRHQHSQCATCGGLVLRSLIGRKLLRGASHFVEGEPLTSPSTLSHLVSTWHAKQYGVFFRSSHAYSIVYRVAEWPQIHVDQVEPVHL